MAFNVTFNGTTYPLPSVGDRIYATYINTFLTAVANNALAKSGGTFTLTADVNFGASYGPIVGYIKSRSSNISLSGVIRLANAEGLAWRNAANSADLPLVVSSGDRLQFNSVNLPTISSTDTLSNKSIDGTTNTLTNIPSGALGSTTGSGAVVLATSPTLVTPALGTPSSATLTNATGLPIDGGTIGTLPVSRGGTGITAFGTGVATALGQNVSGSGSIALTGSPTFTTPALGTPSAAVLTNATGLPLTTGVTGTLGIGNGGTGQTTANAALNALLPSQASSANKYLKTDGTNTSWASASGGAGEINAILNASGADGTTGWTNVSVVSGSSSPLNPIITTAFSIANTAASESSTSGGYYPFTMPSGLLNRKLKVEFTFTTPATDVWRVSVYSGSTRVPLSTDSSSVTTLPASTTGKYVGYFDADSSTSWTLSITRTSGSTGACVITNVIVGPGIQPQGAVVGEWISYTPTWTGGSPAIGNGTLTGQYRRVGSNMECQISIRSGTTTTYGSGGYTFGIPSGHTIDTSKLAGSTTAGVILGSAKAESSTTVYTAAVSYNSTTSVLCYSSGGTANWGATVPFTPSGSTANQKWELSFSVPIAEWAGSGTVNLAQNDVEYASNSATTATDDSTSFAYGPNGSLVPTFSAAATGGAYNRYVQFQTPIQATDIFIIEVQIGGTGNWLPCPNVYYDVSNLQGSTRSYGWQLSSVNSTTLNVQVGLAGSKSTNSTYQGAGQNWPANASDRWRVRKSSAGAAVGFGIVVPGTSSGLVSASGLPGNTTGSAIASGYVGQVISFTTRTVTVGGTGTWYAQATEMGTLTAGVWLINAFYNCPCINATNAVSVAGVATSSSAGTGLQSQTAFSAYGSDTGKAVSGPCVSFVYSTSSSQNIYAQFYSYNSAAVSPTVGGYAIRIA